MGTVEALAPAWPSWMAGRAPWEAMNAAIGAHASRCSSFHRPVSHAEMRPSGVTAVASATTIPKPPAARAPRCWKCQPWGTPSRASHEYWHIGGRIRRLRTRTPLISNGSKIAVTAGASVCGVAV